MIKKVLLALLACCVLLVVALHLSATDPNPSDPIKREFHSDPSVRIAFAQELFDAGEFSKAIKVANTLIARFVQGVEVDKAKDIISKSEEGLQREEAEKAKKDKERLKNLATLGKNLKTNHDKVEGTTWHKSPSLDRAPYQLYVGEKDGKYWLRKVTYYRAEKWLFYSRVVAHIDGDNIELKISKPERDHSNIIWEWTDDRADASDIVVAMKIIEGKDALLRFYGQQYHADKKVTKAMQKGLMDVLKFYQATLE